MAKSRCEKHDQLMAAGFSVLERIRRIVTEQMEAFEAEERERFMQLDRELENTVGEKERAIGALREHDQEHGCQR